MAAEEQGSIEQLDDAVLSHILSLPFLLESAAGMRVGAMTVRNAASVARQWCRAATDATATHVSHMFRGVRDGGVSEKRLALAKLAQLQSSAWRAHSMALILIVNKDEEDACVQQMCLHLLAKASPDLPPGCAGALLSVYARQPDHWIARILMSLPAVAWEQHQELLLDMLLAARDGSSDVAMQLIKKIPRANLSASADMLFLRLFQSDDKMAYNIVELIKRMPDETRMRLSSEALMRTDESAVSSHGFFRSLRHKVLELSKSSLMADVDMQRVLIEQLSHADQRVVEQAVDFIDLDYLCLMHHEVQETSLDNLIATLMCSDSADVLSFALKLCKVSSIDEPGRLRQLLPRMDIESSRDDWELVETAKAGIVNILASSGQADGLIALLVRACTVHNWLNIVAILHDTTDVFNAQPTRADVVEMILRILPALASLMSQQQQWYNSQGAWSFHDCATTMLPVLERSGGGLFAHIDTLLRSISCCGYPHEARNNPVSEKLQALSIEISIQEIHTQREMLVHCYDPDALWMDDAELRIGPAASSLARCFLFQLVKDPVSHLSLHADFLARWSGFIRQGGEAGSWVVRYMLPNLPSSVFNAVYAKELIETALEVSGVGVYSSRAKDLWRVIQTSVPCTVQLELHDFLMQELGIQLFEQMNYWKRQALEELVVHLCEKSQEALERTQEGLLSQLLDSPELDDEGEEELSTVKRHRWCEDTLALLGRVDDLVR